MKSSGFPGSCMIYQALIQGPYAMLTESEPEPGAWNCKYVGKDGVEGPFQVLPRNIIRSYAGPQRLPLPTCR